MLRKQYVTVSKFFFVSNDHEDSFVAILASRWQGRNFLPMQIRGEVVNRHKPLVEGRRGKMTYRKKRARRKKGENTLRERFSVRFPLPPLPFLLPSDLEFDFYSPLFPVPLRVSFFLLWESDEGGGASRFLYCLGGRRPGHFVCVGLHGMGFSNTISIASQHRC